MIGGCVHVRQEADSRNAHNTEVKGGGNFPPVPKESPAGVSSEELRREGVGTDLSAQHPLFFLSNFSGACVSTFRFTYTHLYRDIYILNYLQNCNRWARRDLDTFLLIIKEKLPPPFFFFCLKYIPVPPTTVFLNS